MKKFLSVFLVAAVLILNLALSAFATNIIINGGVDGATYEAFKILDATDGGDGKFAYSFDETFTTILQNITGKTESADVVAYIAELDADGIRDFASAVYAAIEANSIDADYTTVNDLFEDVEQGYYLIAETEKANDEDTFSLLILNTAGKVDLTVNTKEDKPTVDKKVEEKNDSTGESSWSDAADYDIGDSINFVITGTVSNEYENYKSYYYSFVDTMSAGLTFTETSIVITLVNGETTTDVTDKFTVVTSASGFTATANLKEMQGVTIDEDSEFTVEYSAVLNENAVSGIDGNSNRAIIKYENNPYHEADGELDTFDEPEEPGVTVEHVNVIFTFNTSVDKVDGNQNALAGAGFTLYKWHAAINDWEAVGEEITNVTTFEFKGLDAGDYKLCETTVPAGYNKSEDLEFSIVATYDTDKLPPELTSLVVKDKDGVEISDGEDAVFSVDLANGTVGTTVINNSGSELPDTGGIGTTIFYILGAILVLVAAVFLVAKKVMAKGE